jgi:hypothetical protein
VTFKANGGLFDSNGLEEKTVNYTTGSIINRYAEEIPTHLSSGTTFLAWYKDEDLNHPWNFDDIVWLDTTLLARWEIDEEEIEVIYDPDLESEGGGGKVFILDKSLALIMDNDSAGKDLCFEIMFLRDILMSDPAQNYPLQATAKFGRMSMTTGPNGNPPHNWISPGEVPITMGDVNGELDKKPFYEEGETAMLRLSIDTIQGLFKLYYDTQPDQWNKFEELMIVVEFEGFIQLTGRVFLKDPLP